MSKNNSSSPPFFIITIDTEGDNLWSFPHEITTANSKFIPRFQGMCERYGFKPVYLTNYEMVRDKAFVEFGKDCLRNGTAEIGMHLHAWNNPPLKAILKDDFAHNPYLIEYPEKLQKEKITLLTELLEETFEVKMVSHRAGRWAINSTYVKHLISKRYLVDCSVTPMVSWRYMKGNPNDVGGSDFSFFPRHAYYMDPDNIDKEGISSFLEVPMTISSRFPLWTRISQRFLPPTNTVTQRLRQIASPRWLRPDGKNILRLHKLVNYAKRHKLDYIEFMLHSSELMPGGSPVFKDEYSIERLYDHLDELFSNVCSYFSGITLKEYYQWHKDNRAKSIRHRVS
jgi:hypothetical protein